MRYEAMMAVTQGRNSAEPSINYMTSALKCTFLRKFFPPPGRRAQLDLLSGYSAAETWKE
uniref:Uncharacterized protein n=1 Tax=Anguilla anguilla TaxID=7936 RepID=A0A0E9UFG6_ANGAN